MENKGKDTTGLRDKKFLCELAFLSDIVSHLDVLHLPLQGQDQIITDMYAAVRAFKNKLCLWKTQMPQGNFSMLPNRGKQISPAVLPRAQFAEKKSTCSAPSFPGDLPILRLRKGDLNCSVTCLRSTWKAH